MFIKAKNGNVVETDDREHSLRALADGHEVFTNDPRGRGKPKPWNPDGDDTAVDDTDADTE